MNNEIEKNTALNLNNLYAFYFKSLLIIGILLAFYFGWFLESDWHDRYLSFIVENTSRLLNAFNFEHRLAFDRMAGFAEIRTDVGGGIVSGGLVLVNRSSDAFLPIIMMLGVLLMWPGNILKKLVFAIVGLCLMVCLNLARIAMLVVIDHYWPLYFPMFNQWVSPALMIFAVLGYFYLWTRVSGQRPV